MIRAERTAEEAINYYSTNGIGFKRILADFDYDGVEELL